MKPTANTNASDIMEGNEDILANPSTVDQSRKNRGGEKVVEVPTIREPITKSPGFAKKLLSTYKLDLLALCGFGCRYCSSNEGNYLRINRKSMAEHARDQLGEPLTPADEPRLIYVWPEIIENLENQLSSKRPSFGRGETLVFSMLTDGFSPWLVKQGITERALKLVLEETEFRIRVLTKNAIVGKPKWIEFFSHYPDRFVVGLSTGTLDDAWARQVEIGTSSPTARLEALRALQDAGIPTFGMMCPVFPDVLEQGKLEELIDRIRPDRVEHLWAEPYNDRQNWKIVRDSYPVESYGHSWLTAVYECHQKGIWSRYATELYERLRNHAESNGWLGKLRYLLYEDQITGATHRSLTALKVFYSNRPRTKKA